jgi:hypothetical protein
MTVTTSCLPSARGPTTSARLSFAGARRASAHRERLVERDELRRLELPRRGSRRVGRCAASVRRRARGATPGSASEFASVFRRCANAPRRRARARGSGRRDPRERDERRVDVRRGRNTVRETGWKPVRAA